MALIDEVKRVCERLAPLGWNALLQTVTGRDVDFAALSKPKLRAVLTAPIDRIARDVPGFEDFHRLGNQLITPGEPAKSLLYHALASPAVHPTADGLPAADPNQYASLDELDVLENFIYSLAAGRDDLADTVIAVFAYQYRVANRTPHLNHADMAYSRTGVARVGTAPPHFDASRRGFWVLPPGQNDAIAVLPARYGVYLARKDAAGAAGSVQTGAGGASQREYLFPVHKLFPGKECLAGRTLSIDFAEIHRNEKLKLTHELSLPAGRLPVPQGLDPAQWPYVRDSRNDHDILTLERAGASVLVVPKPAAALVRTAAQKNQLTGKDQIVHFMVPWSERIVRSTLAIPSDGPSRLAPEYVNIRHEVDPKGAPDQRPRELGRIQDDNAFLRKVTQGGYAAAHFLDDTCDGCVEAVVDGLAPAGDGLPAFSLITAPDFFPLADQIEVETAGSIQLTKPLSRTELPANPNIPRPSEPTRPAFDRHEETITAVVGAPVAGERPPRQLARNRMISYLPDAASGIFAPGWDVSRSRDGHGHFLTSSGLGSPFPEDAKLCAAIASFWPAVAPDNGRTFGNRPDAGISLHNQLPMLDRELGFHPNHERVRAGEQKAYRGWDGEYGPFFETVGNRSFVNFVSIERSDYVSHAINGLIRVDLTAHVQSAELIARNEALAMAERAMQRGGIDDLCLVSFRQIADWPAYDHAVPDLEGGGYLLEFAELENRQQQAGNDGRVRRAVKRRHICRVAANAVAYKRGNDRFVVRPLP